MVDSRSLRQHSCLEEDSGSLGLPHCKGGAAGGQAGRQGDSGLGGPGYFGGERAGMAEQ